LILTLELSFAALAWTTRKYAYQLSRLSVFFRVPLASDVGRNGKTTAEMFYYYGGTTLLILASLMFVVTLLSCVTSDWQAN
jgi:hypothetical protein